LRPELRDAVKTLAPGQVSLAIKLPNSYAIVKVLTDSEAVVGQGMGVNRDLALAGKGAVRYPPDVAGQVIADLAFQKFPKPAGWEQDLHAVCEARKRSLVELTTRLERRLLESAGQGAIDAIQTRYALAQIEAYQGRMAEAIAQWEAALQIASAQMPAAAPQLEAVLGTAYFHKAEMANAAYRAPGERCLFPPRGPLAYVDTADSRKAIQHLTRALEHKPDDLQIKWLLNLAYMMLGQYPAGVPPTLLISPSAFASKDNVGRFVDVAPAAGLDLFTMANGLVVDDFDGDGLPDVVTSSYDVCEPMHFFHNDGDGRFSDRSAQAGLGDQLGGLNLIQADYDNDGCLDVLVLRGAWEFPVRKSLLRNNCNGTFSDVTRAAGIAEPATRTQAAVWADVDNDGAVDLFAGSENGPSQFFRNKGDGTFEDISHAAGVDTVAFTKGVAAADYDADGFVDLYVSNLYRGNFLYHNEGNGTFREVSERAGVRQPQSQSFATWFFDYDNDGRPDLFAASYFFSVDESLRSILGLPRSAETAKLYRNRGDGTFEDVTTATGLDRVFLPMGANFGDVDNDGFLDVYLAIGGPEYGALLPNALLRNRAGTAFTDITASSGTGDLHKGHGTAFADLDGDGDEDLVTGVGGATPGDAHALRLFENPGHGNDWLGLKLLGVKTNRAALGARIKLSVENQGRGRWTLYRTVGSGGSFGASPLEQHIGLGRAARVRELEIVWPGSRTRQTFSDLPSNRVLEIKELAAGYRTLERRRYRLGGAGRDPASAGRRHSASGLVLSVDRRAKTVVLSCPPIPGYRDAGLLNVTVRPPDTLDGVTLGALLDFTLLDEGKVLYAEGVRVRRFESLEQEPLAARRLKIVESLAEDAGAHELLSPGQAVPDFTLTDQKGRSVTLSQFAGKVVAINFIYTQCPLPDYCFRLSNTFGVLQRRLKGRLGRELVLLTVTFDPVHDQPAVLADYAKTWKADPEAWRFLTGSVDAVRGLCRRFGVDSWPDEARLTHSLHTVVIDRHGRLAANLEGNQFTPQQLGDLLEAVMRMR
jgi:cytochrome oxidase Cu insertion factor (SCO1/SenC/PrrC family)/tetratricopeptide (TPR) repeat protein